MKANEIPNGDEIFEGRRGHGRHPGHAGHGPHMGPPDWQEHGGRGFFGMGRGMGMAAIGGFFGGMRGRARRGEMRYLLLDVLRDGPKHGYDIVKTIEERTGGRYVPSPGSVYPTMQYLADQGLVKVDQDAERRVYELTDKGRVELDAHAAEVKGFWERFTASQVAESSRHEVAFLMEDLDNLSRTIWGGLREAIEKGDQEKIRSIRKAVENSQNEIRGIISGNQ